MAVFERKSCNITKRAETQKLLVAQIEIQTSVCGLCKYFDKQNGKICICIFVCNRVSASAAAVVVFVAVIVIAGVVITIAVAEIHFALCIMLCFDIVNGKFMRIS